MKNKILIPILSLFLGTICEAQINTTWKYHKLMISQPTDSINFFNSDSLHNLYTLEKIRITFKNNNVYEALYFNGEKKEGFWKIENNKLIVDADTNAIVTQTTEFIRTEGSIISTDMGYYLTGKIITELVRIPDCLLLESVASGDWNDPAIWSCNRAPNKNDNVIIHPGHTITLSQQMGTHNCKKLTIEFGGKLIENGKIYVYGD